MHPQFLDLLRCPKSGEKLTLNVHEWGPRGMVLTGTLLASQGVSYPIVRGIPRFVDTQGNASSFGYQWRRWPRVQFESENVGKPMSGHTTRMWEAITGVADTQVKDRTIVEVGCGPGRFLDVVCGKGGRAVGIDVSVAVESARHNFLRQPDVLIVQAELSEPPFMAGAFDGGFSVGVLHHTENPFMGLKALALSIKPGGWLACCVYPKGGFYDFPSVARYRNVLRHLMPVCGYTLPLAYAYTSAFLLAPCLEKMKGWSRLARLIEHIERHYVVALHLPDVRWRVLDTFDAITPRIATTHTFQEVSDWMERAGCVSVRQTAWCDTSVTARVPVCDQKVHLVA